MEAYLLDWANLLVRWLHLIAGVAWIGASFYFVMLDMSLRKPEKSADSERGVFGESWAVHGGGVYHSQKYLAGPIGEPLSEHLHWSKWEAYTTWMSGIGLMAIIYWFGASTYLIDPQVKAWTVPEAIGLSIAFLVISWLVYDGLCRVMRGRDNLLAAVVFVTILAADWLLFQLFSARAAYIHVGAIMGTMMAANVFFHIIPGQKKMIAEIRAGETPNPQYGIVGKQRSVHNTYFTLPVLFIMISNHYPMTYAHPQGWIVLALMMIAGVLIRQYFVLRHVNRQKLWMPIVAVALLLALLVWLMPKPMDVGGGEKVAISEAKSVVALRCISCHAEQPIQPGFVQPPKGVILETEEQMLQHAATIAQTVQSRYMPIGNLTGMTDDERSLVVRWASQATKQQP